MSTIPESNEQAVAWVVDHLSVWQADPASIGLDPADITSLAALASTASSRLQTRNNARDAAIGATGSFNAGAKEMRDFASLQVQRIRTFARAAGDPSGVYEDAGIPAPADPAPAPAPGTPQAFTVALLQNGAVELKFKCPNPPRTGPLTYRVERQTPSGAGQAPFVFLTNAKERSFVDGSIPPGTAQVVYRVTAQSSTRDGSPGQFGVQFGAGNQAVIVATPSDGEKAA